MHLRNILEVVFAVCTVLTVNRYLSKYKIKDQLKLIGAVIVVIYSYFVLMKGTSFFWKMSETNTVAECKIFYFYETEILGEMLFFI